MKKLILIAVLSAAAARAADCPVSECNYLDPQYTATLSAWMDCTKPLLDAFDLAMKQLAILYPRFGIAWQSQEAEVKEIAANPGPQLAAATKEAHRRFEDRILQTAEPEALEMYNLWQMKVKQQAERCGPIPEPPRI